MLDVVGPERLLGFVEAGWTRHASSIADRAGLYVAVCLFAQGLAATTGQLTMPFPNGTTFSALTVIIVGNDNER